MSHQRQFRLYEKGRGFIYRTVTADHCHVIDDHYVFTDADHAVLLRLPLEDFSGMMCVSGIENEPTLSED